MKTGNVLSNSNIFDVNNIEIEKKGKTTNEASAKEAIKKGFKELLDKILLKDDIKKLDELKSSEIRELVTYYQVSNKINDNNNSQKIIYNISFDKDKIHELFYKKNISYSEIINKELFILPILKKENQIFIYNKNFFYENWNKIYETDLIEFILPTEKIEIIQNVNIYKNNLLNLKLNNIFQEYAGNNLAIVLIEENNSQEEKIYFKLNILEKEIVKNIVIKKSNLSNDEFKKKIITKIKKEIINLIKSENLIDVRIPSFLNVKVKNNNKNNLVELKARLKKIDLIDKIYVQKFNNKSLYLRIKYLGKLDKIIKQLENHKIILKLIDDEWRVKII